MGTARLKEAKTLTIRVNRKGIIFELDIADEDVIETMIVALDTFIRRGFPIRIIQTSSQALSKSQTIYSRILTNGKELKELSDDIKKLSRVQRSRL